ncbi:MAG: SPOR domain-containing protein [Bacteroidales bacterium]|nr:SPOR domain-containing protein [Bacteroidales bacterium]
MINLKTIFFLIISLIYIELFNFKYAEASNDIPNDFCITQEELKLFNLINNYRKKIDLPEIPLSKSLSYVAKLHINDLYNNKPDTNICNFHSWSDKGKWSACCFSKENIEQSCMWDKPKELTSYEGKGYEITFWESVDATAETAFKLWISNNASNSMILNSDKWEKYNWNAIGVGIYKAYSVVWFGEETDKENEIKVCGTKIVITNKTAQQTNNENNTISSKTGRYYLIFGSFTSSEEANKQIEKYKSKGFTNVKLVIKDKKHRVSLSDHSSLKKAKEAKAKLDAAYKDVWIMEY